MSLSDFAIYFFKIAHVASFECRSSENYVNGHYFLAPAQQSTIRVMVSDEDCHGDCQFWIQITASCDVASQIQKEMETIAAELANNGYTVTKCIDLGRITEQRISCSPKSEEQEPES